MPDWGVNLIVGILSVILGFVSGFFTKSMLFKFSKKNTKKIKQKQVVKKSTNAVQIGEISNEQ